MGLLDSLDLNSASSDPNAIPDGTYDGEVMKSELVFVPSKNTVSHVITYKVTDGPQKGAQKAEWYELGVNPVKADNSPATSIDEAVSFTPTMAENRKPWYNKRATDLLGERFTAENMSKAVGIPVAFNVKTEGNFQNIKWVNKRAGQATQQVTAEEFAATPATVPATAGDDPGF